MNLGKLGITPIGSCLVNDTFHHIVCVCAEIRSDVVQIQVLVASNWAELNCWTLCWGCWFINLFWIISGSRIWTLVIWRNSAPRLENPPWIHLHQWLLFVLLTYIQKCIGKKRGVHITSLCSCWLKRCFFCQANPGPTFGRWVQIPSRWGRKKQPNAKLPDFGSRTAKIVPPKKYLELVQSSTCYIDHFIKDGRWCSFEIVLLKTTSDSVATSVIWFWVKTRTLRNVLKSMLGCKDLFAHIDSIWSIVPKITQV